MEALQYAVKCHEFQVVLMSPHSKMGHPIECRRQRHVIWDMDGCGGLGKGHVVGNMEWLEGWQQQRADPCEGFFRLEAGC